MLFAGLKWIPPMSTLGGTGLDDSVIWWLFRNTIDGQTVGDEYGFGSASRPQDVFHFEHAVRQQSGVHEPSDERFVSFKHKSLYYWFS